MDHHSPIGEKGEKEGEGVSEEEMRLDGWLKLSEITADLLQQDENTTGISRALDAWMNPGHSSAARVFPVLPLTLFISVSKNF